MKKTFLFVIPLTMISFLAGCNKGHNPDVDSDEELCLTVVSEKANLSISFLKDVENAKSLKKQNNLEYKKNDCEWEKVNLGDFAEGKEIKTVNIASSLIKGDKIYLRGDNPNGFCYYQGASGSYEEARYFFSSDENDVFDLSGNIMSLISSNKFTELKSIPNDYCFECLFSPNYGYDNFFFNVKNASELILPALELKYGCYEALFDCNNSLEYPPSTLPALNVEHGAYGYMFEYCQNLIKTPDIKANKLDIDAMYNMFYDCKKLTQISEFHFSELQNGATSRMFFGCKSLTNIPLLPTKDVNFNSGCCVSMFEGCSNLDIKVNEGKKLVLDATVLKEEDADKFDRIFKDTKSFESFDKIDLSTKYYC